MGNRNGYRDSSSISKIDGNHYQQKQKTQPEPNLATYRSSSDIDDSVDRIGLAFGPSFMNGLHPDKSPNTGIAQIKAQKTRKVCLCSKELGLFASPQTRCRIFRLWLWIDFRRMND
ncbi:hypothetical protein L484_002996 [Morus notabilis]|uniref:Uncharacterized protein n=1 Tax=Morus notabilis TaxID=981085 RepID=W9R5T7_9ROSA|nr:hypothetical protein L484_002996 [Morus notabilis]